MTQNYETLELAQAERIDLVNQVNTNWADAAKFTEQRIAVLEKIASQIPTREAPFVESEQQFLNNSLEFIQTFSEATQRFVDEEVENTRRIQQEIENHRPEQESSQSNLDQIVQAIHSIEERIRQAEAANEGLYQKKHTLAEQVKPAELEKVTFKDFLDDSNDVFKWALQVIYKESKTNYSAKNFKAQAFKKDKGADFLARLKGLAISKLRKDDFTFSKHVIEKKDAYLADLEPKGKQNPSLRTLFEYIGVVAEAGDHIDVIENAKVELEEQKKQLEHKQTDKLKVGNLIHVLEGKLKASQVYIEKLERLNPLYNRLSQAIQQRQHIQRQYQQILNGDTGAYESMISGAQQNVQYTEQRSLHKQTTGQGEAERQTYEQNVEGEEGVEGVEKVEGVQSVQRIEGGEDEEGFEGQQVTDDGKAPKKVESKYPVPATDLKESEFANSKKGSCESCNIF
jgi:chromosome segregation ATPase